MLLSSSLPVVHCSPTLYPPSHPRTKRATDAVLSQSQTLWLPSIVKSRTMVIFTTLLSTYKFDFLFATVIMNPELSETTTWHTNYFPFWKKNFASSAWIPSLTNQTSCYESNQTSYQEDFLKLPFSATEKPTQKVNSSFSKL